jgi:hypothetical protein
VDRREYDISLVVNGRRITKVVIDPHYELKHSDSVSDEVIIELVKLLDGGTFPLQEQSGTFAYFVTDGLKLNEKIYKLVWLLEDDQLYIGVVNAYRRKHGISKRKGIKES